MDECTIVILYLNLVSYVNMPKNVFFGNFNQQISFFYKIVKTFLLLIACSQNCELRMQLSFKNFLLSL
jgi:hypothetical protein